MWNHDVCQLSQSFAAPNPTDVVWMHETGQGYNELLLTCKSGELVHQLWEWILVNHKYWIYGDFGVSPNSCFPTLLRNHNDWSKTIAVIYLFLNSLSKRSNSSSTSHRWAFDNDHTIPNLEVAASKTVSVKGLIIPNPISQYLELLMPTCHTGPLQYHNIQSRWGQHIVLDLCNITISRVIDAGMLYWTSAISQYLELLMPAYHTGPLQYHNI